MQYTINELAKMIDHTNLKAYADDHMMKILCDEALKYNFKMVAINPSKTLICKEYLKDSKVHIGAAIGFPLGQNTIEAKVFETKDAILKGADEIDYVINIGELKNHNYAYIKEEMEKIVQVCREYHKTIKVIFEICYLSDEEIIKLCKLANEVKPDFVKTSTGFGTSGATLEAVSLMRDTCIPEIQVKAAGGIRDVKRFLAMIKAGATRIGTSSGVKIIEELSTYNSKQFEL